MPAIDCNSRPVYHNECATMHPEERCGECRYTPDPPGLVIPQDWTFKNKSVAENFDRHVREQLPWYDMATGLISHFGRHYLPENGRMYDLGASTGNITKSLRREIESRKVEAVSIDYSQEMRDLWDGLGVFECADVRTFEYKPYDFAVCFLILMFLPPCDQAKTYRRLLDNLRPGGALLIFDKTSDFDGYLGTVVHRMALAGKVATGCSANEIIQKELSLAGAQRPINPREVFQSMANVKEVFRFGEFAGWVVTR